jgi:hypothetical protein
MGTTGLKEVANPLQTHTSTSSISDANSFDSAKSLYEEIRHRLIDSVYKNWRLDHVFWEQYNDQTQLGQMTHPFTGWTTLIVLIMSETYGL